MWMISACLAGEECRYDGRHGRIDTIARLVREGKAIQVCPEVLGGLSTPREPAEIIGGTGEDVLAGRARVMNRAGEDVTEAFIQGAKQTLEQARRMGITKALLKQNSPSCGSKRIYDGQFAGVRVPGEGVTVALLRQAGIKVYSEDEWVEVIGGED
ncbi:DUF523 domain-containing protein [Paenibacillus glufosinatiresistens]|uniref:DUF523 domain-containing protein n=1 Tax=Paenibacillus glufosinatiresistens TaxID=3070657 RepID=UPI00286DF0EE|nr:DUF523 domain-containing protein [Paenibacillus sp. YX.27]